MLIYERFDVEDGENKFYLEWFIDDLKKFGLKPSDNRSSWKKYDYLLDVNDVDFYFLEEDEDYEDEDDEDEDGNEESTEDSSDEQVEPKSSEAKKHLEDAIKWCNEILDEMDSILPWMDNCDNNHSFSYDLKRRPAGVVERSCHYNYDATSYKDILKIENDED